MMIGEDGLAQASQSSHPKMYLLTKIVLRFPYLHSLVAKAASPKRAPGAEGAEFCFLRGAKTHFRCLGLVYLLPNLSPGTPIQINAPSTASKSLRDQTRC